MNMFTYLTGSLIAVLAGFVLDFIFGDPSTPLHPICLIGNLIAKLEKKIRPLCRTGSEGDAGKGLRSASRSDEDAGEASAAVVHRGFCGEFAGGVLMAVLVIAISTGIPALLLFVCYHIHYWLGVAVEAVMCFFLLAVKSLKKESMNVKRTLETDGLEAGRKAVARIVGRDTQALTETGVVKAAVETVAENFSDGVFAPMVYMMLGGGVLGFFYKSINTMDSMVGYKNEKYLYFGRFAAKLDDVVNYIPARLAALMLVLAAPLAGLDGKNAWKIWRRDRRNHASPNSAQTESAAAGALHVQLAGDAYYFGKLYKKPYIGDDDRPIEREDIVRVNRLMVTASILSLAVLSVAKAVLLWAMAGVFA
ncbi:MAG: adenosylcobinamide-phosphate synthase CbiB [Lachnospiraceae bacterium]|nr:adenosylcobinamide-phosphate synthase CbiB [Lachnospiraceae bacterium]